MTQPDELTRLREWNASLRENITHIAGQLVERTKQLAEHRLTVDLIRDDTQAALNRMGDNKPGKVLAIGMALGAIVAVLVGWVW